MVVYWFYPFIVALGAFTCFINAMAGGAHMFTLPVLASLGVDFVDANNAAKFTSFVSAVLCIYASRNATEVDKPTFISLFIFCMIGALIGTYFSLIIPRVLYEKMLYYTMFFVSIYLLVQSKRTNLERFSEEEKGESFSPYSIKFALVNFLFSFYVGFMFIGAGIIMFYIYSGIMNFSINKINGMKFLIVAFTTGLSVISVVLSGNCNWKLILYMCVGGLFGSAIGMIFQLYFKRAERYVAKLVTLMAFSLSIKIILDLLNINLI